MVKGGNGEKEEDKIFFTYFPVYLFPRLPISPFTYFPVYPFLGFPFLPFCPRFVGC
jgi:hypothetical protein